MKHLTCGVAVCLATLSCGAAEKISIQFGGLQRSYLVHAPRNLEPSQAVPVVIALHGTNMQGTDMLSFTDLQRKADAEGFLLVAPNSTGLGFNDGLKYAGSAESDDVGFITAVADDVQRRFKVRTNAIYLVGFSNGGSMTQRMQIESAYPFAAYVSVANTSRIVTEGVKHPAPLLLVFGTADPLNPVAGGEVAMPVTSVKPAHSVTARGWAARIGCEDGPVESVPAERVKAQSWSRCKSGARVELYSVEGLGHHWAGAEPMPFPSFIIGDQVDKPNLTDLVWKFLNAKR